MSKKSNVIIVGDDAPVAAPAHSLPEHHGLAKAARKAREVTLLAVGDAKFDLYNNALPPEVRKVVIDKQLCPRTIYKEYRSLKKVGLIAKYCA
jgi:hypothetical protein